MLGLAPLAGGGLTLAYGLFIPLYEYETMLVIEDGSVVAGANSYVDADDVVAYAALYGGAWSPSTEALGEQAILRAMLYVEGFADEFRGDPVSGSQALSWPREYVADKRGTAWLDATVIPDAILNAVCEAAIIELANPGTLQTSSIATTQTVKRLRQKVDVLEKETEYFEGSETAKKDRFEKINAWLEPFLQAKSNRVVRG